MNEQELRENLGKNIKFFRFRRQLSQADLAEKIQISITSLSAIERGNNFPQAKTLCNLAQALDVEVWSLFKGDLLPSDSKEMMSQLSEDITKNVSLTIADVLKQYMK